MIESLDMITCLAIDSGAKILAGGSFQKIWLWNLKTNNVLDSLGVHSDWILSIAISKDGNTLISGSKDKTIKVWNLRNKQAIYTLKEHSGAVNIVQISPDNKLLISGSDDKTIKIWDLSTGKLKHTLKKHSGAISSLSINPNGKILVSGSADKTIKVWDLQTGKFILELKAHQYPIQAVSFNAEGDTLISSDRNGTIKLWSLNDISINQSDDSDVKDAICGLQFFIIIVLLILGFFCYVFWLGILFILGCKLVVFVVNKIKNRILNSSVELKELKTFYDTSHIPKHILTLAKEQKFISLSDKGDIKYWYYSGGTKILYGKFFIPSISSILISTDQKFLICGGNTYQNLKFINLQTEILLDVSIPQRMKIDSYSNIIEVGQTRSFSITGIDINGKEINNNKVEWEATGGRIGRNGFFTAGDLEGNFEIKAKVGIFERSTQITIINSPKPTKLVINPSSVKLEYGQVQSFNFEVLDRQKKVIKETVSWTVDGGGIIDRQGNFKAGYQAGNFEITASVGLIKTIIPVIIIEPPRLEKLFFLSSISQIEFGQSFQFIIQGLDQYDNYIQLKNIVWTATSGTIDKQTGVFQASYQEEIVTVTVTVNNFKITNDITVYESSRLTKLEITPSSITLEPEQEQDFRVIGLNQRGEKIPVDSIFWQTTDGIINKQSGHYYTKNNQKGYCEVIATVGKFRVTANIFVPAILKRIVISEKYIEIKPEEVYQFTINGFDQIGEHFEVNTVRWTTTKGNLITPQGFFKGGYGKREVFVTATVGKNSDTAKVIFLPILKRLEIIPKQVYLKPDESQTFTVQGLDQYGQLIDPGYIIWEAVGGEIDENGKFTADHNAKGYFQIIATSQSIPRFSKNVRTFLFSTGVFTKLLAWFISYKSLLKDILWNDIETLETQEINNVDSEIYDLDIAVQNWMTQTFYKSISRFLNQVSKFCFKLAKANLSASADVYILPVLRSLQINPSKVTLKNDDTYTFTVRGFDQHFDKIEIQEKIVWKSIGGQINQHGILLTGNTDTQIKVIATLEFIIGYADITVIKKQELRAEFREDIPDVIKVDRQVFKGEDTLSSPNIANFKKQELKSDTSFNITTFKKQGSKYLDEIEENLNQEDGEDVERTNNNYFYSLEKSWFYRSQLFYDGYSTQDFIDDYTDYLDYQDMISYSEFDNED